MAMTGAELQDVITIPISKDRYGVYETADGGSIMIHSNDAERSLGRAVYFRGNVRASD